ncbi:MAG: dienelactone hydrolase family protein [Terriglobales bacterium]
MLKVLQDPEIVLEEVEFKNGPDNINGFLARPRKTGRFPALVVVPGDPGLTAYTRVTVAQFAQAGFVALAVDIFSRSAGIQDLQEARRIYFDVMSDPLTLGDLQSAIVFLNQQKFVRTGGVGVVGFCLGGRYALLLSTLSLDVRAVVAFYGPLALQSGAPDIASATPVKLLNHDMSPIDFVSWIKAPIQGHYSERDDGIPVADVRVFESALRGKGRQADFFLYDAPSHFHSFHEASYDAAAASLAWSRTIKFLRSFTPQNSPHPDHVTHK